jgi:hypothetical protein
VESKTGGHPARHAAQCEVINLTLAQRGGEQKKHETGHNSIRNNSNNSNNNRSKSKSNSEKDQGAIRRRSSRTHRYEEQGFAWYTSEGDKNVENKLWNSFQQK